MIELTGLQVAILVFGSAAVGAIVGILNMCIIIGGKGGYSDHDDESHDN